MNDQNATSILAHIDDCDDPSLFGWLDHDRSATRELLFWIPAGIPRDKAKFREPFGLRIRCYTAGDGVRRFSPVGSMVRRNDALRPCFDNFIATAWLWGFERLRRDGLLSAEMQGSYRLKSFIFQRVRGMRSFLGRRFNWSRDLYLRRPNRPSPDEENILGGLELPKEFHREDRNENLRPSIKALREAGDRAARDRGVSEPTRHDGLHYGLYEAARVSPLYLQDDQVPDLIRRALFAGEVSDWEVDPELRQIAFERLCDALERHLDDDTDEFNDWFFGSSNSLIKQMRQRKKARGGKLTSDNITTALLDLGWDSYTSMAHCLSIQRLSGNGPSS